MKARLIRGIGANALAQAASAGAQLVSVPVLIHAWGTEAFGLWLTLVASTSLLNIADCGIMAAAGNAMLMEKGRGRHAEAARLFARTFRFVLTVAAGLGAAAVMGAAVLAAWSGHGGGGPDPTTLVAALALSLAALASLPLGTLELGFRADDGYAAGVMVTGTVRMAETVAMLVAALSGSGPMGAAVALLAVRLIGTVGAAASLRRRASWLELWAPDFAWRDLQPLVRPALAVLAIPAGFALSLQGTTIAAGLCLSAQAVAMFVASRTLTRAIVQALGLVNHAIMPEMASAAGRREQEAELLRFNFAAGLALLLPGWIGLVAFGPALMAHWTLNALRPDPVFFGLMATAALLHGLWLSAANLKLAVNRQGEYAYAFVATAAAGALLALMLGRAAGLYGVAATCVASEAVMAMLVLPGQIRAAWRPGSRLRPVESSR